MKRICILGATGFIGSALAESLERNGVDWVGISRVENNNERILTISLDEKDRLANLFKEYPIVVNAMGSLKPVNFEQNPKAVFQSFWESTQVFSKALLHSPVEKLVHISSGGTVYGDTKGLPAKEDDLTRPISWYGKAKLIEETLLEKTALQSGFPYVCARVSNPYGNTKFTHHGFIDVLLNTIKSGGVFRTFSSALYSRDFIYCEDMAETIYALAKHDNCDPIEIFNVGSGISTNLHKIVLKAKELAPSLDYRLDRIDSDYEVVQSCLDVSKLKKLNIDVNGFKSVDRYLEENLVEVK